MSLYQTSLAILVASPFIFPAAVEIASELFFYYFFLFIEILHQGSHSCILHICKKKKKKIIMYPFILPTAVCHSVDFLRSKYVEY